MILGSSEIFKRIVNDKLVENLPEEFIIEGVTVDVRLNKVYEHRGGGQLFEDRRNTGDVTEIDSDKGGIFNLVENQPYLIETIETFNMPDDLCALIDTRTTIFRSACLLKATYVNPGYKGPLTFLFTNLSKKPIPIERGFRVAQLAFFPIIGTCTPYNGNWQNGKVHSNGQFDPAR